MPFPIAVRSKAWVCYHALAGIAVSNPAGTWMSVVSGVLRRADHLCHCYLETSRMRKPRPTRASSHLKKTDICLLNSEGLNTVYR